MWPDHSNLDVAATEVRNDGLAGDVYSEYSWCQLLGTESVYLMGLRGLRKAQAWRVTPAVTSAATEVLHIVTGKHKHPRGTGSSFIIISHSTGVLLATYHCNKGGHS